jgi:hypothetical protein
MKEGEEYPSIRAGTGKQGAVLVVANALDETGVLVEEL